MTRKPSNSGMTKRQQMRKNLADYSRRLYKTAEGPEAKAWRRAAEHNERYGFPGLDGKNDPAFLCLVRDVNKKRLDLFSPDARPYVWWPEHGGKTSFDDAQGRTLAAWFLYWMCRAEGV